MVSKMLRISKEDDVLELFFNYPSKHWQFKKIKEEIGISDTKLDRWLKIFVQKRLIEKIIDDGKMPYYIANHQSVTYKIKKQIFTLEKLEQSGLLDYLNSMENVKAIVLFGSFSKIDWHKNSDIDIFIYGDITNIEINKYEKILGREIQIFLFKNKTELKKINKELLTNIIKGDIIKGDTNFLQVAISE